MRNERRMSGSVRGGEKPAAERQRGAHRLLYCTSDNLLQPVLMSLRDFRVRAEIVDRVHAFGMLLACFSRSWISSLISLALSRSA